MCIRDSIRGIFFHILGHNDLQYSFDYVYVDVLAHYHRISIEMYNPLFGTMDAAVSYTHLDVDVYKRQYMASCGYGLGLYA